MKEKMFKDKTVEFRLSEAHIKRRELTFEKRGIEAWISKCGLSKERVAAIRKKQTTPYDKDIFEQRGKYVERMAAINAELKILNILITELSDTSHSEFQKKVKFEIDVFKNMYLQKMDLLIDLRNAMNEFIREGCAIYGDTEFMNLVRATNRKLPSLQELIKEKNSLSRANHALSSKY